MEKKEEKLREINELLKREIEPQMEKLKKLFFFFRNYIFSFNKITKTNIFSFFFFKNIIKTTNFNY